MNDVQHVTVTPDAFREPLISVRCSAEILERAKTKDRPDVEYGTSTKVEINFSMGDVFDTDQTMQDYVATLHKRLEEACQSEIRRRRIAASLAENPLPDDVPF